MRNYFDFDLKGSRIFVYVFMYIVLTALISVLLGPNVDMSDPSAMSGGIIFKTILNIFCSILLTTAVAFFVVRSTIEAISYNGERLTTDYNFGNFFGTILLGAFLTAITCGIYYPWFLAKIIRYFAGNTTFRGNKFDFRSSGVTLFGLMVLCLILPIFLMLVFMSLIYVVAVSDGGFEIIAIIFAVLCVGVMFCASIYQVCYIRWIINFAYGPKVITTNVAVGNAALFIIGQVALSVITIGLYAPMAQLRIYRYFINRTMLGEEFVEDKFGFTLNVWKDYFYVLGQVVLAIITVGIYGAWAFANIYRRIISQTYVEVIESEKIPMVGNSN